MKIIKTIFNVACWVFVVTVGVFLTAFFINAFTDPKTDNTTAAISMLAILLLAFVFLLFIKLIKRHKKAANRQKLSESGTGR